MNIPTCSSALLPPPRTNRRSGRACGCLRTRGACRSPPPPAPSSRSRWRERRSEASGDIQRSRERSRIGRGVCASRFPGRGASTARSCSRREISTLRSSATSSPRSGCGLEVALEGTGLDAELMREYFAAWDEREAYAVSHVGWGTNPRARWEALALYDRRDVNGTEQRAFAGNFLYSTGANEVAGRRTLGHFDQIGRASCREG